MGQCSIGSALGFVVERFSFRISDGTWAVLLGFCDFRESIQGNGGLESGLCHRHLPRNSLFTIVPSDVTRLTTEITIFFDRSHPVVN